MISISHLTALDAAPEDFIDYAAAAGFEGVGLRINPPAHTPLQWPIARDIARARSLRRRADDAGIAIFEVESFSIWPETTIDALRPGLEAGAVLGARFALAAGIDSDEGRMVERYSELAEAAREYGLSIAIEFMPFRELRTLPDAVRVLARVNQPNVAILIDVLHLSRSGGQPADVAALPAASIAYVHLCDAAAAAPPPAQFVTEARSSRTYPGDAGLPLAELLAALPAGTPLSLEAPDARYADRTAEERIRLAGKATLDFLGRNPQRRGVPRFKDTAS